MIDGALSGVACAKLLRAKGYEVYLSDQNKIKEKEDLEALGIIVDEGHSAYLKQQKYDLIVKNPGIPYTAAFVRLFLNEGYFLYNEIDIAQRYAYYQYGAITGTNGKTTTTALLAAFLKCLDPLNEAVGNIGLPLSELVLKYPDHNLTLAVEVGAFQALGLKDFHPKVSVCTNLTPDHLNYFDSVEDYYRSKMRIYQNQRGDDWFLLNIDDEKIIEYAKDIKCKIITYSLKKKADLCLMGDEVKLFDKTLFKLDDLKLPGEHNLYNAMVASSMAYKLGVKIDDIQKVLHEFKGVRHRLEFVREINGVRYYNDSKGTNPDATINALKAFDKIILLAGGYDKKTGFDEVIPYLGHVKAMCLFGETKYEIQKIYPKARLFETMQEALAYAHLIAEKGDTILLSPMCASWDQFPNFEKRGDIFVGLVNEL